MRARARAALIGVVLLLLVFLIARRLGEEDRAAPGEGSNSEVGVELPGTPPTNDGERRSLIPDWKPSELGEPRDDAPGKPPKPGVHENAEQGTDIPALAEEESAEGERSAIRSDRGFGEGRIVQHPHAGIRELPVDSGTVEVHFGAGSL
jgi:hypothetical protein